MKTHVDQALLRHRRKFVAVVRRLVRSGLFRLLPAEEMKETVGVFFVQKNGKTKVRLVIDARRSNCHFAGPPSVDLLTGEGLAGIEVELPPDVEIGSQEAEDILQALRMSLGVSDVSDAFHTMRIPRESS